MKKGWRCKIGWHSPSEDIGFDGCSAVSVCKRCGDKILQDSQGNWFSARPALCRWKPGLSLEKGKKMETREGLAEYAHEAWSGWIKYMFEKSIRNLDGSITIPPWAVERWERQARTPYSGLREDEQASDLAEADQMLSIFSKAAAGN